MPRADVLQSNFTAGEISPAMLGRVDVTKFFNGAQQLENFYVKPQGGAFRRMGTQYVGTTKSGGAARLIPFEFNAEQAYVLEFGNLYVRIWRNNAGTLEQVTTNGTTPVELTTPYPTAALDEICWAQSADVVYLAHPDYAPRKFARATAAQTWADDTDTDEDSIVWNFGAMDFLNGPYEDLNTERGWQLTCTSRTNQPIFQINDDATGAATFFDHSADATGTKYIEYRDNITGEWRLGQIVSALNENLTATNLSETRTSTTSTTIATGSKAFTAAEGGSPDWVVGSRVRAASNAGPSNYMEGIITSVSSTSVTILVDAIGGSGTYADWDITPIDKGPCVQVNALPVYTPPDKTVIISDYSTASMLKSNYSGAFKSSDVGKYIRVTSSTEGNGTWHLISSISTDISNDASDKVLVTSDTPFTMKSYSYPTEYLIFRQSDRSAIIEEQGTPSGYTAVLSSGNTGRWVRLNLSGKVLSGKFTDATTGAIDCSPSDLLDFEFPYDEANASNLQDGGSTRFWSLGAWGGSAGWPALVAFHEERLVFARTTGNPQGIWFSVAGDYENFSPTEYDSTVLDDNAISITLAGGKANYITWIQSGPTLLAGTIGSVWSIRASGSLNEPLTPSNTKATVQSGYGAVSNDYAVRIGDSVFFIQRSGRKLRETRYSFDTDSFIASDATIISEHIFRQGDGAKRIVYSPDPNSIMWALLNDGTLAGLTYDKEQEVYAWHRHSIGGDGEVESIVCVPDDEGQEWQLWLIVKRTIDGSTVRYIEVLGNEFNPASATDKDEMKYVDSWAEADTITTTDGVTTATGFDHLEGATVHAVLDGAYDGSKTVSGGEITLTRTGTTCIVGLPYTSTIKTVPYEGGNPLGTSQGRTKGVARMAVRLLNTLLFKFGQTEAGAREVSFRSTIGAMDSSSPLFTGDKEVYSGGSYDGDGSFFIIQEKPFPLNVLAIMPELKTNP